MLRIFFLSPGVKVVKINEADDNGFKAIIKAEADCPLGEHKVRLRTRGGLSELRTFYVGPFPTLREVPPRKVKGRRRLRLTPRYRVQWLMNRWTASRWT